MRLVLDTGALIGIDRGDRRVAGLIELGRRAGAELVTSTGAVGQAWRDGGRQGRLARALAMMQIEVVTLPGAKQAGELLAAAGSADVIDGLIALLARPADQILTSDPGDLRLLLQTRGVRAAIVAV